MGRAIIQERCSQAFLLHRVIMNILQQVTTAVREVFKKKLYLFAFLLSAPIIFLAFVLIQVTTIPGNNFIFQLKVFALKDYIILSAVSLVSALFFVMQSYIFFRLREKRARLGTAGQGMIGGYGGFVAALFGTASCTSCLASIFGFMGFGTILFLAKYQWLILLVAIGLMLISIYFASKRILNFCASCSRETL